MAKLTFLWYNNFGENQTPLQRNGMAAIPQNYFLRKDLPFTFVSCKQECNLRRHFGLEKAMDKDK